MRLNLPRAGCTRLNTRLALAWLLMPLTISHPLKLFGWETDLIAAGGHATSGYDMAPETRLGVIRTVPFCKMLAASKYNCRRRPLAGTAMF